MEEIKIDVRVTDLLLSVGMPTNLKGFRYAREAIMLSLDDYDYLDCITSKLYPEIAKKFDTKASRVERAIRHAIEVAWERFDIDDMKTLFGNTINLNKGKPTNSEFLSLLTEKIMLEVKYNGQY